MLSSAYIKEAACIAGFNLCGITSSGDFVTERAHYNQWLSAGMGDALPYMHQYLDVRFNPADIMEGCKTAVVCAVNYKNNFSLSQCDSTQPKIASYALNEDYHRTIRHALKSLLRSLQSRYPSLNGRCCVDTAPLLEKHLAQLAGLGWIGRQSLLVTPQYGTFVLLGVLLLNDEVDTVDEQYQGGGCGTCQRCIDACPNSAINNNHTIDSKLCISAQTVECEHTSMPLNGWIFGCDECQSCCPYNQKSPLTTSQMMTPIYIAPSREEWQSLTKEEFVNLFNKTPLKRAGLERIQEKIEQNFEE